MLTKWAFSAKLSNNFPIFPPCISIFRETVSRSAPVLCSSIRRKTPSDSGKLAAADSASPPFYSVGTKRDTGTEVKEP